jgi:hypothetical protein
MFMKKLAPVKPFDFQTAEHRYRRFDCVVPNGTTKDDLENPALWTNVAPQMRQFDEVRAVASDGSFVAYLIVTFSHGTDARLKVVNGVELEEVDDTDSPSAKHDIKLRGTLKWCIVNLDTGENIKTNIPTKSAAQRELEDYLKALSI